MDVKAGDWIVINEEEKSISPHFEFARKNKLPLFVYNLTKAKDPVDQIVKSFCYVYTSGLSINNFVQNPFAIKEGQFTKITKEEAEKMEHEINKEHYKKVKLREKLLKTKRVPINQRRDYLTSDRTFITTQFNYALLFNRTTLENCNYKPTTVTQKLGGGGPAQCCSFSKNTNDIIVYIPKSWLNYYGYNLTDLKSYFSFLSKCEIGYNARVVGIGTLKEAFVNITNNMNLNNNKNNYYQNIDEDCYIIHIPGSKINMHTYMHFILTRFIYSSLYWNIPFIAMKLKKHLPKATHWECLLIAHCNEDYSGYYAFQANTMNNLSLPSKYNAPKAVLDRVRLSSMNASFKKYNENSVVLRKNIREENYEEIQKLINRYRDVN